MARQSAAAGRDRTAKAGDEVVRALPLSREDADIVRGLRAGEAWARAALFDRHAPAISRTLRRLLGPDVEGEHEDLLHEVFVQALSSVRGLRNESALRPWLQTIASRTAYRAIRSKQAKRWLKFWEPSSLPEVAVSGSEPHLTEACRRTYAVLDRMPVRERVPFLLRYVEKLELREVASACDVSLATIKRRLSRARERFAALAAHDSVLCDWVKEGGRWTS
ncbi:MAG: sigma-70 family RNA polymerase sigma factor [Deltaproteobacteria bacterium]|jgi:RNA polymerase sigma-70 factor (ECF subfamily)|nr:sigma-70 family RNA polymerase sigma factor [Deltaproteobacteria bacterium]MBW2533564.1 sigma-70 family RNA polymerase sigma factor [Deltaproteobacteria bacterium]